MLYLFNNQRDDFLEHIFVLHVPTADKGNTIKSL